MFGKPYINARAFEGDRVPEDLHDAFYDIFGTDPRIYPFELDDETTHFEIDSGTKSPERLALNYIKQLIPQVIDSLYQRNGSNPFGWTALSRTLAEQGFDVSNNEQLKGAFKLFVRADPRVKQKPTENGRTILQIVAG